MKQTQDGNLPNSEEDGLFVEYDFDDRKAKPNRLANQTEQHRITVTLAPDVAEIFKSSVAVNYALRALLSAISKGT